MMIEKDGQLIEEPKESGKGKSLWIVLLIVLVLGLAGVAVWKLQDKPESTDTATEVDSDTNEPAEVIAKETWQKGAVAIAGNYADADVVKIDDTTFRMYYSIEPEVKGNKLEMYSATSTDGITWTAEAGARKTLATFPDAIKLPDNSYRIYFQNAGVIKSATSTDGLTLKDEAGVRIDGTETGFDLENVAAPTTLQLSDGSYLMVYRGTINTKYGTNTPNQNTQLFFYATSTDGLTWVKKGLAVDSRNATLSGLADGPELIKWDDGSIRLYFWTYTGVYHVEYENAKFSETPVFDFMTDKAPGLVYAPNPPGDPAIAKIGDTWYMYYGQHEQGIYSAILSE